MLISGAEVMRPMTDTNFRYRHLVFALLTVIGAVTSLAALRSILLLSLNDARYTHIPVIPAVSALFIYLDRKYIFGDTGRSLPAGIPLTVLAVALLLASGRAGESIRLTVASAALILFVIGAIIISYGLTAARRAVFPLLFLVLAAPVPSIVLDKVVAMLQAGSAHIAYGLFRLSGIPVFKHGLNISLPGLDIEVAPECSGIRSSMAFLVATIIICHMLLRSAWAKAFVVLCVVPIAIFRNAVRIVCISLLGLYVDKGFLFGNLHRRGGIVFALIGFVMLIPLVWVLRKLESRAEHHGMALTAPVEAGGE